MRIGVVRPDQHESLVDLLVELHACYHDGRIVDRGVTLDHLRTNLLAAESAWHLIVASRSASGSGSDAGSDADVLGLAVISLQHSLVDPDPASSRQCSMKELYVRSAARGDGVGEALMAWVSRWAVERGCCRIDWNVHADNTRGIAFYERLGAARVVERAAYRLTPPAMLDRAAEAR